MPTLGPCAAAVAISRVQVAHRVAGLLGGQVVRVGRRPPGRLARVGLDQLAAVEELHQLASARASIRCPMRCSGTE